MGWWLIPAAFTFLCVWWSIDTRNTVPRDFWGAVTDGSGAVADFVFAVIASIFAWLIYAIFA